MSQHDLTLQALAREMERQAKHYEGWPDTQATERQVQRITAKYCEQCKARWGIEMVATYSSANGIIEIGAEPATELDAAMLAALIEQEQGSA
jgi:hypothetical protein